MVLKHLLVSCVLVLASGEESANQAAAEAAIKDDILNKKVVDVFPKWDVNGDGLLTKEEFVKVTRPPFLEDKARAWWARSDLDKDDLVTLEEYYALYKLDVEEGAEVKEDIKKFRRWEAKKFKAADVNQDGVLTWNEFSDLVETRGETLLDLVAKAEFIGADEDKDRFLTLKEFKDRTRGNKAMFGLLDKDSNKALTYDEYKIRHTSNFQYDITTVLIWVSCDTSKDDKLSHEEMFNCAKAGRKKSASDILKAFRKTIDRHSDV